MKAREMLRRLVPAALFAALSAGGCESEPSVTLVPARQGNLEVEVTLRGTLQAAQDASIKSPRWGEIKRLAPNGSAVKAGDVVLEMADDQIENNLRNRRAEVEVSAAELRRSQREVAAADRDAGLRLAAAKLDYNLQLAQQKELLARPTEREMTDAQARLDLARTLLVASQEAVKLVAELVKSGYAPQEDLRQAERDVLSAQAELAGAESQMQTVKAGATVFDREQAAVQLETARLGVDSAEKNVETVKEMGAAKLARFERRLERNKEQLAENERQFAESSVRCPVDGIVLYAPRRWGGTWQAGYQVWQGATIMSVPNLARMKVLVQVPADRVRDLEGRQDLVARVEIAALPGKVFSGKLAKVSPIGKDEFESLDPGTAEKLGRADRQVFEAEVSLDEEDSRLRPGMSAETGIVLRRVTDKVIVPLVALNLDPAPATAPGQAPAGDAQKPAQKPAASGAPRDGAAKGERGASSEGGRGAGRSGGRRTPQFGVVYVKVGPRYEGRRVRVLARGEFEAAIEGQVAAGDLLYPGKPAGAVPPPPAENGAPESQATPDKPKAPAEPAAAPATAPSPAPGSAPERRNAGGRP